MNQITSLPNTADVVHRGQLANTTSNQANQAVFKTSRTLALINLLSCR